MPVCNWFSAVQILWDSFIIRIYHDVRSPERQILWDSFIVMHPWFHTIQNSLFFAAPPPLMQAVMPMPPPHVSNIIQIK